MEQRADGLRRAPAGVRRFAIRVDIVYHLRMDPPRPCVRREETDGRVWISLDDPGHGNLVGTALLIELAAQWRDHRPAPLVLSTSAPPFSLGADCAELAGLDSDGARGWSLLGQGALQQLAAWPAPTLALVHGPCIGQALELILHCDVIACSPDAGFAMPGLALGLLPAFDGLAALTARGPHLVNRLFLDGEVLDAPTALATGLADRLVADGQDLAELLARLDGWPPGSVSTVRRLRRTPHRPPEDAARLFAAPFASGVPQRRLKRLQRS